jgi:hypothetical protein
VYHEYRQKAFLHAIKNKIQSYNLIFGWASRVIIRAHNITSTNGIGGAKATRGFDSDFAVLDQSLRNEGISSIIGYADKHSYIVERQHDIDLIRLFGKPFVSYAIFDGSYESLSLDCVARSLLKHDKTGKGSDIEIMTGQQRIEYCKNDISILYELVNKLNDAGVFKILYELSKRTGLGIGQLANNQYTNIW